MTAALPSVAFHVGAHKTATSHLQRCLSHSADALAGLGVQYFGPKFFRKPGQSINAVFGLRDPQKAHAIAPKRILDLADGAHRVVLSEENYIGPLNDPRGHGLSQRYGDAAMKIGLLGQAIGQDIDVLIAVRQPTGFLNAAFCQMLLGGNATPFAHYRNANPTQSVDWPAVIAALRGAKGVRHVTVWRYEDYAQVFSGIARGLVGRQSATALANIPRRINEGLSQAAVMQLLQEAPLMDPERGHTLRGALPISVERPRFDGFTAAEHAISAAVYDEQMDEIVKMEGVTVLRPENG